MHDIELDDNPRPLKRQRPNSLSSSLSSLSSSSSSALTPSQPPLPTHLTPIPPPHLLLALPPLLIHPPTHISHLKSLFLAQRALRRCIALPESQLDRDVECRAWTALAEVGVRCLAMGMVPALKGYEEDIEIEVEKALTKALLIAQKSPSLRWYYPYLTILASRLSHHQHNPKFAHHSLRRLLATFLVPASDPPQVIYSAHLALVDSYLSSTTSSAPSSSSQNNTPTKLKPGTRGVDLNLLKGTNEIPKALAAIQDMHSIATARGDASMGLLALLVRVLVLVRHGVWAQAGEALAQAETVFTEVCPPDSDPVASGSASPGSGTGSPSPSALADVPNANNTGSVSRSNSNNAVTTYSDTTTKRAHLVFLVHLLIAGVVYHTYAGDAAGASERLRRLHALLDAGVLSSKGGGKSGGGGMLEIPFLQSQSIHLTTTHPRILYVLAFLLSAVGKRDAVGRKPKKGVFAREGLGVLEREGWGDILVGDGGQVDNSGGDGGEQQGARVEFGMVGPGARELSLPVYASIQDLDAIKKRMAKMKAELLSEVVTISTMRSEFDTAHNTLNKLIAHTRTHELFPLYAARITLLQAQLAHALGRTERAIKCYRVAALLAAGGEDGYEQGRDEWIRVAARAGEVWVRIGVVRRRIMKMRTFMKGPPDGETRELDREREQRETDAELESLRDLGTAVCAECDVLGGTLSSIACVLRACLVKDKEYLSAKQYLRKALDLATRAGDNHLRALVLALVAAQYTCTARDHAASMLGTCEQLAAGMGAGDKKGKGSEKENIPRGEEKVELGNAHLRLWVGERFLELHGWAGETAKAERQARANERLREAVRGVERCGVRLGMAREVGYH